MRSSTVKYASNGLHVGMYIRMAPGSVGGIAQAVMGLVDALGKLDDGPERYTLVTRTAEQDAWLKPHLGANQQILRHPSRGESTSVDASSGNGATRFLRRAARYVQHRLSVPRHWPEIPVSDGFLESLSCDVIHFPTQWFALCNVPSVYNPHDLLHLAYPQFFSQAELIWREVLYPAGCRFAHTVVVGTQWVKEDVARRYGTHPEKIQVIPWASPTVFYGQPTKKRLHEVRERYRLPEPFALYPAVTWPHKNHVRLLEALAYLRDSEKLTINLVCTGALEQPGWQGIQAALDELNLASQTRFLGFVPQDDLRALYRLAHLLVLPTLYEADSNPIHEAWSEGVPVASSNVTALPDQVRDAGILFDPLDTRAIADALKRLTTLPSLRDELRERGRRRAQHFDWEKTAKAYRAVYRQAAGRTLTKEDRWLLQWDWMRDPDGTPADKSTGERAGAGYS